MKRYLRLKGGKIIDTKQYGSWYEYNNKDIVKQADTIEKLVKNGDLVKVKERITIEKAPLFITILI